MEIIISLNDEKLKHYLEKYAEGYHYIYLGERRDDISQLLKEHASKEIKIYDCDDSAKDRFLRAYIDLIGKLGQKYNSIYWWATHTAAKNPYGTGASFDNLFIYYNIIRNIDEFRDDNILIINPPPAVCSSVVQYCAKRAIKLQALAKPFHTALNRIRDLLGYGMYLVFIIQMWRKIYISNRYLKKRFLDEVNRNESYYALRSWFYERSISDDGKYRDTTFGVLPDYLAKNGKRLLVVAGIIGDYKRIVQKIESGQDCFIFPQELFLKYTDPVRAVIDVITHKISIDGEIDFEGLDVADIIKAAIDKEFSGGVTVYMHYYYARRLLENVSIDTYTTTYENNAWEKVNIFTLRKYAPQIKIIGHQCTPLFAAKIAIMAISKYEKDIIPLPDKINTIGKVTKSVLEEYGSYERSQLKESCALRIESFNTEVVPRGSTHRILVILGGIPFRAINLMNFVHRALKDSEKYQVIIRTHPALPLEKFRASLDFDISSWTNYSLSSKISVVEDLQEADMIIHEGSTIALEALRMGIPVIYAGIKEIISFDPLIGCNSLKWVVNKEEELVKTIKTVYELPDNEFYRQQSEARKYVSDYIYEVTEEGLSEFII